MTRILIAEDEAHILRVMSMWLARQGYDVLEAGDGQAALALIRKNEVDLIISDMNMPVVDGLALVRAVRLDLRKSVPILLLTARCDQGRLAAELAPYDVRIYPKPFTPSRLVKDIQEMLAGAVADGKQA